MIYAIITLWIVTAIARAAQHTFLSPFHHWDRSRLKKWRLTRLWFEKNLFGIKIFDGSHTCAFAVETAPVISFAAWVYFWLWDMVAFYHTGEFMAIAGMLALYFPTWYLVYFWVFNLFFHKIFVAGGDGRNILSSLFIYFPPVDLFCMSLRSIVSHETP